MAAGAAALLALSPRPDLPPAPPPAEVQSWARFRGPGGLGVSPYPDAPADWDGPTRRGILWKSPVPLPGEGSPIAWGNRVFVTGATKSQREVYCYEGESGRLLWRGAVTTGAVATPEGGVGAVATPEGSVGAGFAAPTPATDGERVFAMFANGDLACFDFRGRQVWARNLGAPKNAYGHASSPIVWGRFLILQFDQGEAKDALSALVALDAATGETVWQADRPVGNSWSTPIVIETGKGPQVVTCANPWVIAYDPADGTELWRAECLSGDVAPSPAYADGLVFAVNSGARLAAIRADGSGDVTKTHVAWTAEEGLALPEIVSPLADEKRVWILATYGTLTCLAARDGKKLYEKDIKDASFNASPTLAAGRIYLLSQQGVMFILSAGDEFKEITRSPLGEKSNACPAFLDGRIYIRGEENLYCIRAPQE